jgi:hypothetical protein
MRKKELKQVPIPWPLHQMFRRKLSFIKVVKVKTVSSKCQEDESLPYSESGPTFVTSSLDGHVLLLRLVEGRCKIRV